jgi:hypothetical protein
VNEPVPNVLEYFPEERDEYPTYRLVVIAPIIAALAVGFYERTWIIPSAAAAAIAAWIYSRAQRKRPAARLAIDGSRLLVTAASGRELMNVSLDDLEAVGLDMRTTQPVFQERTAASRAGPYRVGPARDTFRIELVTADRAVSLTEFYTSSIDAEQWLSEIVKFLRKNGWVTVAERNA